MITTPSGGWPRPAMRPPHWPSPAARPRFRPDNRVPGTLPAAGSVAVTAQGPSGRPGGSQAPRSHRHLQISAAIPEPAAGTACLPLSCGICCLLITGGDPTAPPRESTEAYRNRHRTRPRPASASRQPRPARPWPRDFALRVCGRSTRPRRAPGTFGLTDVEADEKGHWIRRARIPGLRVRDPSSVD